MALRILVCPAVLSAVGVGHLVRASRMPGWVSRWPIVLSRAGEMANRASRQRFMARLASPARSASRPFNTRRWSSSSSFASIQVRRSGLRRA